MTILSEKVFREIIQKKIEFRSAHPTQPRLTLKFSLSLNRLLVKLMSNLSWHTSSAHQWRNAKLAVLRETLQLIVVACSQIQKERTSWEQNQRGLDSQNREIACQSDGGKVVKRMLAGFRRLNGAISLLHCQRWLQYEQNRWNLILRLSSTTWRSQTIYNHISHIENECWLYPINWKHNLRQERRRSDRINTFGKVRMLSILLRRRSLRYQKSTHLSLWMQRISEIHPFLMFEEMGGAEGRGQENWSNYAHFNGTREMLNLSSSLPS